MEEKWIVTAAKLYFIAIIIVNLSFTVWGNYQSYQLERENNIVSEVNVNNIPKELMPIIKAGNVAKTATSKFVIGIFASFFAEIALFIPKLIANTVEKYIESGFNYTSNIYTFNKFMLWSSLCNIVILVFDIMSAIGYIDFGKTIAQALL